MVAPGLLRLDAPALLSPPPPTLHQEFIEVGYKMATGPVEALKPAGVRLLLAVLRAFGHVEDPLLPGEDGSAPPACTMA